MTLGLLGLCTALASTVPLSPDGLRIAVVANRTGDALIAEAWNKVSIAEAIERELVLVPGAVLADREQMLKTTDRALRDCVADPTCIAGALSHARLDLAVLGVLNVGLRPANFSVLVVDRRGAQSRQTRSIDLETTKLEPILREEISGALQKFGLRTGGRAVLSSDPAGATFWLDDQPLESDVALPIGQYEIEARLDGFEAARHRFRVGLRERVTVHVPLQKDASLTKSAWFWAGVSAVVVGAAIGVTALALTAGGPDEFVLIQR